MANGLLPHPSSQFRVCECHAGGLKSDTGRVFMLQNLANAASEHTDHLFQMNKQTAVWPTQNPSEGWMGHQCLTSALKKCISNGWIVHCPESALSRLSIWHNHTSGQPWSPSGTTNSLLVRRKEGNQIRPHWCLRSEDPWRPSWGLLSHTACYLYWPT